MLSRALLRDLALFEAAFDEDSQLLCLRQLADLAVGKERGSHALWICRVALDRTRAPAERAEFYGKIAEVLLRRGHSRAAAGAYRHAAALFVAAQQSERHWGARIAGAIAASTYDPAGARRVLLGLAEEIGSAAGRSKASWLRRLLVALGELDLSEGRAAQAATCVRSARALLRLEARQDDGVLDMLAGRAELQQGNLAEAERLLGLAVASFIQQGDPDSFAHLAALEALGWLLLDQGRGDRARKLLSKAIDMADRLDDPARIVRIELLRASSFVDDNPAEATRYLLRAADRLAVMKRRPEGLRSAVMELAAMLPSSMLADQLRVRLSDEAS
jgi:tetratricopeptide (TPR) repeat protein